MAAEYGININVRTRTQALKKLQTDLEAVNQQYAEIQEKIRNDNKLKDLNKQKNRALADQIDKLRNAVIVLNNGFVNNTNRITDSSRTLKSFSQQLNDARKNTKLFGNEYKVLTQGIQKADFTAQFKDLKEFSRKAAITAGNLGGAIPMAQGTSFEDLMSFRPTNTREAINEYLGFLRDLEARLDRTSDRFRQVTARIKEMETQLRSPIIQDTANAYSRPAGPRQAMAGENFFNRTLGRNRQFQQGGMFFEPGGFASRRRKALSSGLIGGGFPLLFGQGIGASVGGGLGGVAGGFLGGGLGFGLSIVGTQLGKQVDVLVQATKATGNALGEFTKDFTVLQKSLGETGTATGKFIELLAQSRGSYEAFLFTQRELTNVIGQEGVDALQKFSNDLRNINKNFSQFFLKLQSGLAKIINSVGILDGLSLPNTGDLIKDLKELGENLLADEIKKAQEIRSLQMLGFQPRYEEGLLKGQIISPADAKENLRLLKEEGSDLQEKVILEKQREFLFDKMTKNLTKQKEISDKIGFRERERVQFAQKIAEFTKKYQDALGKPPTPEEIQAFRELLEAQSQLIIGARLYRDELTRLDKEFIQLNDTAFQLVEVSKAISDGFSESFKGIIKGTMSVSEGFRNMFNRIADHFLDMAAKMAANQLQQGLLSMFGKAFSGGLFSGGGSAGANNIRFGSQNLGINTASNFAGFADGGRPPVGRASIVGERGPELFTPGVSGMITPNHALGGSTNIVVNVDASGSNVEGDEEQGRELGRLISVAVQSELIQQKRPGGLLA